MLIANGHRFEDVIDRYPIDLFNLFVLEVQERELRESARDARVVMMGALASFGEGEPLEQMERIAKVGAGARLGGISELMEAVADTNRKGPDPNRALRMRNRTMDS